MRNIVIKIASDFSQTPGPRSQSEGDCSGEEFLSRTLKPAFEKALAEGGKLIVDLDGAEGYATSFLEASFGGLAREFGVKKVLATVELISNDEPYLKDEIVSYISDACNA